MVQPEDSQFGSPVQSSAIDSAPGADISMAAHESPLTAERLIWLLPGIR
jgi:hypothetical protein